MSEHINTERKLYNLFRPYKGQFQLVRGRVRKADPGPYGYACPIVYVAREKMGQGFRSTLLHDTAISILNIEPSLVWNVVHAADGIESGNEEEKKKTKRIRRWMLRNLVQGNQGDKSNA